MLNTVWVLVCVALVFVMQGGFLCLESGLTRSKDAINVALKNMTDFSVSLLLFWSFGFAVMFGASYEGWIGTSHFFVSVDAKDSFLVTTFLFQAMFCATAATIVSGAVAGRMRFYAYIVTTFIVSGLVYPIYGHWAWGGSGTSGWLAALGFVDFAGCSVVHSVGGWAALAAVSVIGPRTGRFGANGALQEIHCSNLPMAMLGTMLLWMGWIGFNGGSTLAMNEQVPGIIANTLLAGAAGMVTALFLGWIVTGHSAVNRAINGSLAGLVSVTACCHAVTTPNAVLIGTIGGIVMEGTQWLLYRRRIDDAIGAVPVHLAAGIWGTVAVALFGNPEVLGTGLSRWAQLQVQLTGVFVAFALTFGTTYLLLRLINKFIPLRVTPAQEGMGLNVAEHGAATELTTLISEMDTHRQTGDFSQPVSLESFTEVGQIAEQYNQVMAVIVSERAQLIDSNQRARGANAKLVEAQQSVEQKLQELADFNDMAVDREIRMIELKQEVNVLSEQAGLPSRYDTQFQEVTAGQA
ncbi:MAG: ammonium transporter [Fuerstiella sp.]|nr:ammonium transporter [Fuerstiella sp.]